MKIPFLISLGILFIVIYIVLGLVISRSQWLMEGLAPNSNNVVFANWMLTLLIGILISVIGKISSWFAQLVAAPLIEELFVHTILLGYVMFIIWPCAPPQAVVINSIFFGVAHIFTGKPQRVLDGLIMGFFNGVACLVYVRLFFPEMSVDHPAKWIVAFGTLVLAHAVYNFLAWVFETFGLTLNAIGLRIGGILFAIAAWGAWMPELVASWT